MWFFHYRNWHSCAMFILHIYLQYHRFTNEEKQQFIQIKDIVNRCYYYFKACTLGSYQRRAENLHHRVQDFRHRRALSCRSNCNTDTKVKSWMQKHFGQMLNEFPAGKSTSGLCPIHGSWGEYLYPHLTIVSKISLFVWDSWGWSYSAKPLSMFMN